MAVADNIRTDASAIRPHERIGTIPEAIEDLRNGKYVIIIDDANRENEGDLVFPAEKATAEVINFYETHVRGWICVPLAPAVADRLHLPMMVERNTERHGTAFTVTVDAAEGTSTGISAEDQALTIRKLAHPESKPHDFLRPGHVRPLRARSGGVLERVGHTEAVVDLLKLAGFQPAGVLCEIKNPDGSMARLPKLIEYASKFDFRIYTIEDLVAHRLQSERLVARAAETMVTLKWGEFLSIGYESLLREEQHLALVYGDLDTLSKSDEPALVRVHHSHVLSDLFGLRLEPGVPDAIDEAMRHIVHNKSGVFIYIRSRRRGERMLEQIRALTGEKRKQETVYDDVPPDMAFRDYGIGAQIIKDLGLTKIKVVTNHPRAYIGMAGYGIEIAGHVPLSY